MINSLRLLTIASALLSMSMPASAAEEHEMLISGDSETNTLTLAKGETAKLVYSQGPVSFSDTDLPLWTPDALLSVTIRGKTMRIRSAANVPGTPGQAPIVIPGPAIVKMLNIYGPGRESIATFAVTRVGTASPPAEVPQEAGSNFDVVLEQSSDLVNWTPANPGTYSGTETKRFFRTRIVKKQ
jgi:hypothetical protein